MARFLKIEAGLKFECSKAAFESISSDEYIRENFTLTVKELKNDKVKVYVNDKAPRKDIKWFNRK